MEKTSYENWIVDCINNGAKGFNLTLESLRDYQLKKIKETINYAKVNSLFYKERLKNVNSYDIKDFNDFSNRVPYTCAEELNNKPTDFLCVPQHMISRIVTLKTSGTTGKEKRIFFTEGDLERTIDFFCNGMKYLVTKGDRVLILMPGNYYGSIGDLLKKGLNRLGCEGIILGSVKDGLKVLDELKNENIDCIVGIPVQVYQLARYKEVYEEYKGIKLKSVLLSADYVPYSVKEVIKKAFFCSVYTHYGMTEMGFGGGVECKCLCGYHMREADLYFEIIDPTSKEILPCGSEGEIVFTTLTREGMPLIRYRTGDLGRFINNSCECSNILPIMDYVRGRISERVKIGDATINIGTLDESMFTIEKLLDYRAHIEQGNILKIYVKSINSKNHVSLEEIEKAFYSSIIYRLLKQGKLTIEYCGEIETLQVSTGMLKRKMV